MRRKMLLGTIGLAALCTAALGLSADDLPPPLAPGVSIPPLDAGGEGFTFAGEFVQARGLPRPSAQGPTSELFITTSNTDDSFVVHGEKVIRKWNKILRDEGALVVAETVRTTRVEYDLYGKDLGARYPGLRGVYDSTTDGVNFNYGVELGGQGRVFRTDREWANPKTLFSVSGRGNSIGIAYDLSDDTIWIGGWGRAFLDHYSLDGELLGSFATKGTLNSGLAYDVIDDTLWVVEGGQQRILRQYAKDGELLQDLVIEGLNGQTIGAEFPAGRRVECELVKRFNVKCKRSKLKVLIKSSLPKGTELTIVVNGQEHVVVINNKGKAKLKRRNQTGRKTVSVKECPDHKKEIDCGE